MRKIALVAVAFAAAILAVGPAPAYAQAPEVSAATLLGLADTSSMVVAQAESTNTKESATDAAPAEPAKPAPVMVTVQKGDSLSKIAKAHNTTWVRIFDANTNISNPDVINPGDQLRIPTADEQLEHRELPKTAPAPKTTAKKAATSTKQTTRRTTTARASYPVSPNAAKAFIYARESGNNPNATNPNGCYGLGQDCNGVLKKMCGADYACQDAYFTRYAMSRYGSWEAAYSFWQANHWW
jgi:LysM repeat protein